MPGIEALGIVGLNENCHIYRQGKNWYCEIDNIRITVNACSYTIITAHIIK